MVRSNPILRAMLIAAILSAAGHAASAETTASATATVVAHIPPRISVSAIAPTVDVGIVRTGEFSATVAFRVETAASQVRLFVTATPLYKGGVATDPAVAPIPLSLARGVTFSAPDARPVGGSATAPFAGTGAVGNFEGHTTEALALASSQARGFSQDVSATITWAQADNEKPPGEYAGRVVLTATILP